MKDKDYEQLATKIMINALEGVKAQIRKAYDKGYKDGKADTPFTDTEEAAKKAYEQGLNDAWEAARKLVHPRLGGYTEEQKQRIFGEYVSSDSILQNFTAPEVIAKIKAYEDKQKQDAEIEVGDEVVLNANATYKNEKSIILACDETIYPYNVLMSNGDTEWIKKDVIERKTGRHFPQIAEVLKQMNREEDK